MNGPTGPLPLDPPLSTMLPPAPLLLLAPPLPPLAVPLPEAAPTFLKPLPPLLLPHETAEITGANAIDTRSTKLFERAMSTSLVPTTCPRVKGSILINREPDGTGPARSSPKLTPPIDAARRRAPSHRHLDPYIGCARGSFEAALRVWGVVNHRLCIGSALCLRFNC